MSANLENIKEAVVEGKHAEIENLVQAAVDSGADLNSLINDALIAAMDIVGQKFADNEIYVPEMLVAAMTMKKGLAIIKPLLSVLLLAFFLKELEVKMDRYAIFYQPVF